MPEKPQKDHSDLFAEFFASLVEFMLSTFLWYLFIIIAMFLVAAIVIDRKKRRRKNQGP